MFNHERFDMKICDIMTPNVETVRTKDTLKEAAHTMKKLEIGLLPVCEGDHVGGIVTDRDMVVRAVAKGLDPTTIRVRDVMTASIVCCFAQDDAEEAARLMQERRVRRVIVLDQNLRLAGIVSLGDLAADTCDPEHLGQVLQDVSEPAISRR
jgi:CBS domain-containing protein